MPQGFGFAIMRRKGSFGNASNGRGFVVAQLPAGPGGEVCWSAPSFFQGQTTATGFPRGANRMLPSERETLGSHRRCCMLKVAHQAHDRHRLPASCQYGCAVNTAAVSQLQDP